jgi:hypothetical protein
METLTEPILELTIENENNKFSCKVFCHITLAPPKDGTATEIVGRKFLIQDGDKKIYVRLIDFTVEKYLLMESTCTLPCSGLDVWEWRKKFKTKFPDTNNETRIGIYCYERIT